MVFDLPAVSLNMRVKVFLIFNVESPHRLLGIDPLAFEHDEDFLVGRDLPDFAECADEALERGVLQLNVSIAAQPKKWWTEGQTLYT